MSLIIPPSLKVAIVDLYLRRASEDRPAIGILMGSKSDFSGEIQVRSCYPLPSGTGSSVEAAAKIAADLHRSAFPKDQLIGWFSTNAAAPTATAIAQPLKELAARECGGSAIELELHLEPSEAVAFGAKIHSAGNGAASLPVAVECSLGEWNVCRQLYEGRVGSFGEGGRVDGEAGSRNNLSEEGSSNVILPESGELHRQACAVISKLTGQ